MVGCVHFGEILGGAPGLPRSVLSARLRRLEQVGVVARQEQGRATSYRLTDAGRELADVCLALGVWGARWREVLPEHHDPYLVLWTVLEAARPGHPPPLPGRGPVRPHRQVRPGSVLAGLHPGRELTRWGRLSPFADVRPATSA
jgi:hypothetical protein